jgi:Trk K+ transport system NAD-binding subunit
MKFFTSQLSFFYKNRTARSNISRLVKFLLILLAIIVFYSLSFHYIMLLEGKEFSFITGFYWTLTVMSTLGFGDITFTSDLGKIFSIIVLLSGMLFLLVMLPFTFIEFFYAPWIKAQASTRTPRRVDDSVHGHVILTSYDSVTIALTSKLRDYHIPYYFLVTDLNKALELYDLEVPVILGDLDDINTYKKAKLADACLLVATNNDMINTNVTFTARELNPDIPIVVTANTPDSVDILKLAGATQVIQLGEMLGKSLVRRVIGDSARVHVIGRFHELLIGEALVVNTPYSGKKIKETQIRELFGLTIVGVWERGEFLNPTQDLLLTDSVVLVLAGSIDQFRAYDEMLGIFNATHAKAIVIGGGRVGRAAYRALKKRNIEAVIVERQEARKRDYAEYVIGDAADYFTLEKAGIKDASTVLVTTNDDDVNIYLTLYCRKLRPDVQIISRASLERNISTLHRAGSDFVMSYASMGANMIFNTLKQADVLMITEGLNIFKAFAQKALHGKTLIETNIRKITGCSVVAIISGEKTVVSPPPTLKIHEGDELIMAGSIEAERAYFEHFTE